VLWLKVGLRSSRGNWLLQSTEKGCFSIVKRGQVYDSLQAIETERYNKFAQLNKDQVRHAISVLESEKQRPRQGFAPGISFWHRLGFQEQRSWLIRKFRSI